MALAARQDPVFGATAYLCNLEKHWFTLRRIDHAWWKFNSLDAAPSPVSDTYLALLLQQLQAERYTIHVVHGSWHTPPTATFGAAAANGTWFSRESAAAAHASSATAKTAGRTRTAAEQAFAKAGGSGSLMLRQRSGADDHGDDDDLQRALAASLGEDSSRDEELALQAALRASLRDEPVAKRTAAPNLASAERLVGSARNAVADLPLVSPAIQVEAEPAIGLLLAFRLPGKRMTRRFAPSTSVAALQAFVASHGCDASSFRLCAGFPPQELRDATTLVEAGLTDGDLISVLQR